MGPRRFKDEFRIQVMKLVEKKAKAGEGKTVLEPQEEAPPASADVINLTALLQRSLKGGARGGTKAATKATPAKKAPARKAATTRAIAKKTASPRKAA